MAAVEIRAGGDAFPGECIRRGFGPGLDDWHEEGAGHCRLEGGSMIVDARAEGYTAFYREELPADLSVRFVCRVRPPAGANNINLLSHVQPPRRGEWPVVADGAYGGYHAMPNYIATFVKSDDAPGRTRLRRNPGFNLISEEFETESVMERDYEIVFAVLSGRDRYYIDGKLLHDWTDPEPLPRGFFGLRTWKTVLEYREIELVAL